MSPKNVDFRLVLGYDFPGGTARAAAPGAVKTQRDRLRKMNELHIRAVTAADAAALLEIYAPYVRDTAISFEYEAPPLGEFRRRIEETLLKYPYLAAVRGGEIIGYAYTHPFVGRAAYGWSAETTIYLAQDARGSGAGRALYGALESVSRAQNIYSLNACIGYCGRGDRHLDSNSVDFHAHMGYRMVGRFEKCGYKFGKWYDMVWMEKQLAPRPELPPPVIPFPELDAGTLAGCGIEAE